MTGYLVKAMACRIAATVSSLCYGLISLRLFGQYLDPESYGVVVVALQVLAYLPLFDAGFRTSTNREILASHDEAEKTRLITFSQKFYTLLGLLVATLSLVVMAIYAQSPLAQSANESVGFFLALGFFGAMAFFHSQQVALLTGLGAQSTGFLLVAVSIWVNLLVLWYCLEQGLGIWAFPLAIGAGFAVCFPLVVVLLRVRVPGIAFFTIKWDADFRAHFSELKGQAWRCFRSQVSTMLLFTWDIVLVGLLCGAGDAGVYGVLSRVFHIVRTFLATAGDVSWPIVAKRGTDKGEFTRTMLRVNAWLQGATLGASLLTLLPFLQWYMGEVWAASNSVLYLMVARNFVIGLSSPASYFLIGLGRFQELAVRLERELIASCVLAVPLGLALGAMGVALAFLLSTIFASLTPILHVYARELGIPLGQLVGQLWWRGLLALGVSVGVSWWFIQRETSGWGWVLAGVVSLLAALVVATLAALLKRPQLAKAASPGQKISGFLRRY